MIDCEFDTLILSLVLIWIFYVFDFNLQLSKDFNCYISKVITMDDFVIEKISRGMLIVSLNGHETSNPDVKCVRYARTLGTGT